MAFLRKYARFLDFLTKILKVIIILLLAGMILVMTYQTIMRYVFHNAQAWCEELSIYMNIAMIMLSLGIACRMDSHLQVDFLTRLYGDKLRCFVMFLFSVAAIVIMGLFSLYTIRLMGHTKASSITMPIAMKQVYSLFPLGGCVTILYSIEVALKNLFGFLNGGKVPELGKENEV